MSVGEQIVRALAKALLDKLRGEPETTPGRIVVQPRPVEAGLELDLALPETPRYEPPAQWQAAKPSPATPGRRSARLRSRSSLREIMVLKTILDPPRSVRPAGHGDRWQATRTSRVRGPRA